VQRLERCPVERHDPCVVDEVAEDLSLRDDGERLLALLLLTLSLSRSTTSISTPCSSTPSAYRAQPTTNPSPPFLVDVGSSLFGVRFTIATIAKVDAVDAVDAREEFSHRQAKEGNHARRLPPTARPVRRGATQ